jgi:2,3-bisphosphoglycerate-dependent phosphoglycerate mutase
MGTLILLRHGQSEWNKKNIFTGWVDIGLSKEGVAEAEKAQEHLKNFNINCIYSSVLKRAIDTAKIAGQKDLVGTEWIKDQALNERHYGDLQGKNKDEMRKEFGAEQVKIWRRSFDVKPPNGESLKDTCERVLPFFEEQILPRVRMGETVLVSAHGNSLRALIKKLDKLTDKEVVDLEVPTGTPIIYQLDQEGAVEQKRILTI